MIDEHLTSLEDEARVRGLEVRMLFLEPPVLQDVEARASGLKVTVSRVLILLPVIP